MPPAEKVFELEGLVAEVVGARELGAGMMTLELALSPWRVRELGDAEIRRARVSIEMDLDMADAWLRVLDVGDCVRVVCASVSEGADELGRPCFHVKGTSVDQCPPDCVSDWQTLAPR
ncbi:MAG TPA: hypothetical protein VFV99_23415 [Kofleriaceae bacterium]|nr:hypothetical protein [Kofleriaceae bacterium]